MKGFYGIVLWILIFCVLQATVCGVEIVAEAMDMQREISQCVLHIAKNYFQIGSIIGIATTGNKITNKKLPTSTKNLIIEGLMKEMQWTILTKFAMDNKRAHDGICI